MSPEAEEVEETSEVGEDGRPPIDEDEQADVDLQDLVDEVEEETSPDANDDVDEDEEQSSDDQPRDEASQPPTMADDSSEERTLGDAYVGALCLVTAALVASQKDEDVDVGEKAEEFEPMTRMGPFNLREDFNLLLEQQGKGTDLPPGVSVVLASLAIIVGGVVMETDLLNDAVEGAFADFDL